MPRRPADPARRQRTNTPAPPLPHSQLRVDPDVIDVSWTHPATQRAWDSFWRSPLALYVIEPDVPQLIRLHELYDTRATLLARQRTAGITVKGSQGQRVLNPIHKLVQELGEQIGAIEDRFGISPDSRRRLNLDLAAVPEERDDADRAPRFVAIT